MSVLVPRLPARLELGSIEEVCALRDGLDLEEHVVHSLLRALDFGAVVVAEPVGAELVGDFGE